ncbi:RDD family protein [Vibrio sinaloensis]|uniref:RDD family protein n=2 Tax=Photobacterium sp. (strain ATCC 43367) TaxID=379097 RepID=UPI002F3E4414
MLWRRFFAYLIDVLPIFFITFGFFWFFMGYDIIFKGFLDGTIERTEFYPHRNQVRDFSALLCFIYFVIFECRGGFNTVGKSALKIQVVDKEGGDISLWQSCERNFLKFFTVATVGLGFLYVFFNKDRLFLHDKIAGTRLIALSEKPTAEEELQ